MVMMGTGSWVLLIAQCVLAVGCFIIYQLSNSSENSQLKDKDKP